MPDGNNNSLSVFKHEYLELAIALGYDCGLSHRDIITLENRILREGVPFLTKTLPTLGRALLDGISSRRFQTPDAFRMRSGTSLPLFMYDLFEDVFEPDGTYLASSASDSAVRRIHQFTGFFYKMKTEFTNEQIQEYSERFKRTDAEVSNLTLGKSDPVLDIATSYITELFKSFDPDSLVCKDGPGVTANVPTIAKKTAKLSNFPCTSLEYLSHFFVNWAHELDAIDQWPNYSSEQLVQTSKVIFVPKDSRGPRVISAEPRECQWLQQGLKNFMYDAIEKSNLTKGQVNFLNQEINANLAVIASIDGELATLDLSEASDRISCDLVSRLFSGVPELLKYLMISRSVQAKLPSGELVRLSKFAPMGSAVCFPVLAICIWSLLKARQNIENADLISVFDDMAYHDKIHVYGDDIIVDATFALSAIETLEKYGLKVNRSKSFIASDFSESCGTDAFQGKDVTPVRLRTELYSVPRLTRGRYMPLKIDAVSQVETCNQLSDKGYYGAALVLSRLIERNHGSLPFGYDHSSYVNFRIGSIMERLRVSDSPRKAGYWYVKPVKDTNPDENGWSHFMRQVHSLGQHAEIPEYGIYDKYHSVKVARGRRPRNETAYPASGWLPC